MQSITKTKKVKLSNSKEIEVYLSKPSNNKNYTAPTIIVIGDDLNRNGAMLAVCDSLAYHGYTTVCPILHSNMPEDICNSVKRDDVVNITKELSEGEILKDIALLVDVIKKDAEFCCNGKIAIMGYCLGGNLAYLAATREIANCCVAYCILDVENQLDIMDNIKTPFMLHITADSGDMTAEKQKLIEEQVAKIPNIELIFHNNVKCGFSCMGNKNYAEEIAKEANYSTVDFITKNTTEIL